jgi:hypothetical protein
MRCPRCGYTDEIEFPDKLTREGRIQFRADAMPHGEFWLSTVEFKRVTSNVYSRDYDVATCVSCPNPECRSVFIKREW